MLRFYERRYPDCLGRSFRLITIFGCLFGTVQAQSGTFSRINDYPLPGADSVPLGIVTGPDGALWFTENEANRIGRITVDGVITEYPGPGHNSQFAGITVGPDGA